MLEPHHKLVIHFHDQLGKLHGKMGHGVLRYSRNPVVCAIDKESAGRNVRDVTDLDRDCPVLDTVDAAMTYEPDAMLLGMSPRGGRLPPELMSEIDLAFEKGLSIINGLHLRLADRYPNPAPGQWIWDVRQEPPDLPIASALAATLDNKRALMVGTDMAIGKMTVGLEILNAAEQAGVSTDFLATGQIGMCITGKGIPLDAIRVDFAAGAVEDMVMKSGDKDLLIVEGQGSLLHPGSTSTMPLLRGSCPTHLVMCHKAGKTHLHLGEQFPVPDIATLCRHYEDLAGMQGLFPRPKTVAVALNTSGLEESEARKVIDRTAEETGIFTTDAVRYGGQSIVDAILQN